MYTYTPYIWPFICTIIMSMIMIFYVLRNRRRDGAIAFSVTLFFTALWCLGSIMEISVSDLNLNLLWNKIEFPAYTFGPLAWMVMVLQITDWHHWINKKRIVLLSIIPVITVIMVWTNDFHGLIWKQIHMDHQGMIYYLTVKHGLWFWVHAVYSDGLNLFSVILTIHFWRNKAPMYGKQFRCLAFSMIFIMIVNGTYVFKIGPAIDPTAIAWGISSLFITWALFRNKLFDLVPIARNRVMESMTDSIVVFDLKNRMVDMNLSAKHVFNCEAIRKIGRDASEIFMEWPNLQKMVMEEKNYMEFEQTLNGKLQYYETLCLPIKNERGILLGKLIIIRDVTEKKMTEKELLQKHREIALKEERERMAMDLHDNVGQILGFVNVQTQAIREYLNQNELETAVGCLERLTQVVQQAHNTVRQTILTMREDLYAKEKETSEIFNELNRQINLFEKHFGITAEINYTLVNSFDLYDSKVMLQVVFIIKEALNNIIKHSHASAVKISFEENSRGLNISVIDNGCGFNPKKIGSTLKGNFGLLFMEERAKEAGCYLDVCSETGKGTTVKMHVPRHF